LGRFIQQKRETNTISREGGEKKSRETSRTRWKSRETIKNKISTAGSEARPTLSRKPSSNSFEDILEVFLEHVGIMASWIRDVVGGALRVLKTPISYLLAIWLLFGLGVILRTLVTNTMYASLSPVCRIPGALLLNLPFCPVHRVDTRNGPPPPVEFDQLMTVQAQFEEVLEESAGGVSLPMDMKRGEASIRDLRQLVRYSQIHSK
jgi:hypothetical protein